MYTHETKRTKQKCFRACWWPSKDKEAGSRESRWPLMVFESGQINRVNADNLKIITNG